jgi:hypothetical protein
MTALDPQTQAMVDKLESTTGKPLDAWIALVTTSGLEKHGEIVALLKAKHGLGHGYANLVTHLARQSHAGASSGDDLVSAQYAGKPDLEPIYRMLVAAARKFGADLEIAPKKGYVSLRRSKQFGLIQPSTKTRLDVGINLKGVKPAGRLEASGSFNAMVTHRVRVETAGDVDAELIGWLKRAYDAA